jgi:hypothetical protein
MSSRSGGASLDDLVGAQQNRWGYRKTERRGGLAVHEHLELGRKLNGKLRWLRAAQDAIDISGRATKEVYPVDAVGDWQGWPNVRLPLQ